VSTATDIYALGVVLHELAGVGEDEAGRGAAAGAAEPLQPGAQGAQALGPDLRAVLRQALQEQPAQRYASAGRLADDLRNLLAHRPVAADPGSRWHRAGLFGRRHRLALVTTTLLAGVLAAGATVLARQHAREVAWEREAFQSRDFLVELLNDAEPAATQGSGPVTGEQMVDSALIRARAGFAGQPVLRGQMLTELGMMYRKLNQPERALAVLGEAYALLRSSAAADDPALHIGAAQWAIQLNLDRRPEDARQADVLARQVLAGCMADTPRCARARAFARNVLMYQANQQGNPKTALDLVRLMVQDFGRGYGPDHPEVASALVRQAILERNAGALNEAVATLDRARRIADRTTLRAGDLRDLHLFTAMVQGDIGHYEAARQGLTQWLRDAPASIGTARAQRLLAQTLYSQGLLEASLAAADAALLAAQPGRAGGPAPGGGGDLWEATFAHQARARTLAALGRYDEARRAIAATQAGLRQLGQGEGSSGTLRARRIAAEIELQAGRPDAARVLIEPLLQSADPKAPASTQTSADLAQALDLMGQLSRRQGDAKAAVQAHARAAELLNSALPPTHPLLARNTLLQQVARWLAGEAGARPALAAAASRYLESMPAGSAWRHLPDPERGTAQEWQASLF
jgi:serine/threonine-protein kinase